MPGNHAESATFAHFAFPTLTITSDDADIREGDTFNAIFAWSTSVAGFVVGDITVTGATVGTFTGTGSDYQLALTADSGAGNIVVSVADNRVMPGNIAVSATFTRSTRPTITITTTDTDIRESETFNVAIVFSESVTGFTASDITITGGTLGTLTGSGDTYAIPVTAGTGAGSIVISIAANVVNEGNAAASATFTRLALPTITITTTDTDIRENETFNVDISFSESVTGFAVGDITVTGASINALTGSRCELRSIADSEFWCR